MGADRAARARDDRNLATYAPPWMAALPGLGYREGSVLTLASTASTYVAPGGAAVGMATSFAMLRGVGVRGAARDDRGRGHRHLEPVRDARLPDRRARRADAPARAEQPAADRRDDRARRVRGRGRGVRGGPLDAERLARDVGDLAARIANCGLRLIRRKPGRPGPAISFVRFRNETVRLLARRWHVLTLATLAGQLTVFLVMLVSLRVCGVAAARRDLRRGVRRLVARRGCSARCRSRRAGSGSSRSASPASLVGFGGHNADVVAAVLIYRFLTIVPTLLLGLLAGATWRRHHPQRPRLR